MQIIIMKCSDPRAWYKNYIGKVYSVAREDSTSFQVKDKKGLSSIRKCDCEVI